MALRASWEGFLKLSLISVPVRAFNAAMPGGGEIHFNQIHKECGSRIRYQKVCPIHGEVTKDEIVSGYEFEKGKYVEFDPEDLNNLRAENDQSITIDLFIPPDLVDPLYYSGRTYYLVPDGPAGQKPYMLLQQVMKEKKRYAIATVILSGHEQTVVLRPLEQLLIMTVLYYENQIKSPSMFRDEVEKTKVSSPELKLANTLVDASTTDELDLTQYKDHFADRTKKLIEAELSGKKVRAPKMHKSAPVINLMDALRKSLHQTATTRQKQHQKSRPPRQPVKAGSVRHAAKVGKRKTG